MHLRRGHVAVRVLDASARYNLLKSGFVLQFVQLLMPIERADVRSTACECAGLRANCLIFMSLRELAGRI